MKAKKLLSILLLIAMLVSCSDSGNSTTDETTPSNDVSAENSTSGETADETEAHYPYEIAKYGGHTFTFLNCEDDHWAGANHIVDYEELTGEPVSDAIYSRNRLVEEEMEVVFKVEKDALGNLYGKMSTAVNAGDDIYDVAYIPLLYGSTVTLTGDYTLNLHTVESLNLTEEWWNQSYIESATIGTGERKTLHAITDYVNLMGYAYGNILYFNKDMVTNYQLEMPYDAVRNGTWTYDRMFTTYTTSVVSLNGDTDFSAKQGGTALYSFAFPHAEGSMSMLNGAGQYFVSKDNDGMPVLNTANNTLVDAYDKMTSYLSQPGYSVMYNTAEYSSKMIFSEGRAMFYQSSLGLSSSADFRSLELEYGLLPLPKFTEEQNRYYTMVSQYTSSLNIPIVAGDVARTGAIIDYLAYMSYQDVIPTFMNALCYKGIRDDDSIEMLELLLTTQTADIGFLYGWTNTILTDLCNKAIEGNTAFASTVAKQSKALEKQIEKFVKDQFGE